MTELHRTHFLDHAAIAIGLVMLVPTLGVAVEVARDPGAAGIGVLLVMALVLVLLPLWVGLRLRSLQFTVAPDAFRTMRRGRVVREVPLDRLTRVVPGVTVSTTLAKRHPTLLVEGEREGRRVGVLFSGQLVRDLSPAVDLLAPLVAARPDLVPDTGGARQGWERLLERRDV